MSFIVITQISGTSLMIDQEWTAQVPIQTEFCYILSAVFYHNKTSLY